MNITLNGKIKTIPDQTALETLIQAHCSKPEQVVAELNDAIVQRKLWAATHLSENDHLELVSFVGGG